MSARPLAACLATALIACLARADELKPVPVGSRTLAGTVKLKKGVEPPYAELNAELKKKIDANPKYKNACKEAYKQTLWLVDKKSRGVKDVAVWLMPDKDDQFFDVKDLAEKKRGFEQNVVLEQTGCQYSPRVLIVFPGYIDPSKPTEEGQPNYIRTAQKFYVVNPDDIFHNIKLIVPRGGGQNISRLVPKNTTPETPWDGIDVTTASRLKPYDLSKGPIRIACDIHPWMEGSAWALPHPLAAMTNDKGRYRIENVPDSGKVRIFVWHEKAGFINKGGKDGQVIDVKEAKQNFTITSAN